MRKILLLSGLVLLLLGVVIGWRATHPPLSDEQQIAAALDGITAAANARQPRGVVGFLSRDFKFAGGGRKNLQQALASGMLSYRVIDLNISGVEVKIQGETATSEGRFRLSRRSEADSAPETTSGEFRLKWRKEDGEWLVTQAEVPDASF
ncbi:MAG TPA: nuclear transport factor 2 family protein [Abditibacterium sp.]|jgi:ketosteroid isomerase-like protein